MGGPPSSFQSQDTAVSMSSMRGWSLLPNMRRKTAFTTRETVARLAAGDPPVLRRARVFLGQHADHHRLRRGGGGRIVPRIGVGSREPAAHARWQGRFLAGFLWPRG